MRLSNGKLKIAAIRSGTDPVGKLPAGSFVKTLEMQLGCPKCDVSYNMVVDWDQAADRWFEANSQPLIRLLKKAIFMGHGTDHAVTHFETEGVVVTSFAVPRALGTVTVN
jgi:hypothetical protein